MARRRESTKLTILVAGTAWLTAAAVFAQAPCETAQLFSPFNETNNNFGAVSLDGDLVAVADPGYETIDGYFGPGVVSLFRLVNGQWSLETNLFAPEGDEGVYFGAPVAVSGGVVAVSSEFADYLGSESGAVHIYRQTPWQWVHEAALTASDGDDNDFLGYDVSIDGDTVIAGAPFDELDGLMTAGSAYVFRFDPETETWHEEQKLTALVSEAAEGFGTSVAVSGDVAVVGTPGSEIVTGSAFVFRRTTSGWRFEAELIAPDASPGARFGHHVHVRTNVILVGAPDALDEGDDLGAAYVYRWNREQWLFEAKLVATDPEGFGPWFGASVSLGEGDENALVGAPLDFANGGFSGAAYLFREQDGVWTEVVKLTPKDGAPGDSFGAAVSLDLDMGAISAHNGGPDQTGKVYIFTGFLGADCNGNSNPDACDILQGLSLDANLDGVPDECPLDADLNGDGSTDGDDLGMLLLAWGDCPSPLGRGQGEGCLADLTGDGSVNGLDLAALLAHWNERSES
jgi:hypothetical protein